MPSFDTSYSSSANIEDKLQQIQNAKAETEALRHQLIYRKNQVMDSTLSEVASGAPPVGELRLRGRNVFKGHIGKVYAMKLTQDNQYLISAAQDGIILVWDAYTTAKCEAIPLENTWVLACAVSPSNNLLATGGLDNVCTVTPLQEDSISHGGDKPSKRKSQIRPRMPLCKLKGHRGYISQIEFVDENSVITGSTDMTMSYWDVERGEPIQDYGDHLGDINDLSVSCKDNRNIIATASADNTVKIWDLRTKPSRSQQTFITETELNTVDYFPGGYSVAVGGDDGTVKMFDTRSDCLIGTYGEADSLNSPVSSIQFSPSGRLLVTGFKDGSFGQWDILKNTWLPHSPGHSGDITSIQVSNDGHRIYTSSWDSTLRAWEP